MDLVRLKHLGDYWADHPPPHVAIWWIAQTLGVKKADATPSAEKIADGAGDILDMLISEKKG
ncbi:MAG TPA: hypothetical protein VE008_07360 [Burkholderiales bacterium]|nr:hypothetical protein [Burkholderiales bacterium]